MQLAKGLVYLAAITDLVWFQVTYRRPWKVKNLTFLALGIRQALRKSAPIFSEKKVH